MTAVRQDWYSARPIFSRIWIGDGRAEATPKDINRGLYLYVVACLINAMWVAAIAMVRFSL